jgi:hypothetical protein
VSWGLVVWYIEDSIDKAGNTIAYVTPEEIESKLGKQYFVGSRGCMIDLEGVSVEIGC